MFWRIFDRPRVRLISTPTPLEKAVNISRELGIELYIKRDDVMELAFGGNKVRKLEFILGEVLDQGYDTVITRGSYYSNHVRLTAAATRKLGLNVYIVTYPPNSGVELRYQGNVLLNMVFGAKIIHVDSSKEADKKMIELKEELEKKGFKPYIIPVGGSTPVGVLGYALAAYEIMDQMLKIGRKPRYIIHATGTGTTQAGLVLGLKLLGVKGVDVIGVDIEKHEAERKLVDHIIELANKAANLLGLTEEIVNEGDIDIVREYSFGGYGVAPPELIDFLKEIARKEGLILEPVYTGKAMYALYDLVDKGVIEKGDTVVYIHTGGTPLVFQFADEFLEKEKRIR